MKVAELAKVIVSNAVILAVIWAVFQDDAGRLAYFRTLGFTPSTTYYPFFYITSAVEGSTYIQGQLTLDWIQVLVVGLVAIDIAFLVPFLRRRTAAKPAAIASPPVA